MSFNLTKLKKIISNLSSVPENEISVDSALMEDLQLDSLKFVELLAILAEDYQVSIEEKDAVHFQTVGQLHEFVAAQLDNNSQ